MAKLPAGTERSGYHGLMCGDWFACAHMQLFIKKLKII